MLHLHQQLKLDSTIADTDNQLVVTLLINTGTNVHSSSDGVRYHFVNMAQVLNTAKRPCAGAARVYWIARAARMVSRCCKWTIRYCYRIFLCTINGVSYPTPVAKNQPQSRAMMPWWSDSLILWSFDYWSDSLVVWLLISCWHTIPVPRCACASWHSWIRRGERLGCDTKRFVWTARWRMFSWAWVCCLPLTNQVTSHHPMLPFVNHIVIPVHAPSFVGAYILEGGMCSQFAYFGRSIVYFCASFRFGGCRSKFERCRMGVPCYYELWKNQW